MGFRWLVSALVVAFVGAATALQVVGTGRSAVWAGAVLTLVVFLGLVVSRLLYIRAHPGSDEPRR